jgi:transposase
VRFQIERPHEGVGNGHARPILVGVQHRFDGAVRPEMPRSWAEARERHQLRRFLHNGLAAVPRRQSPGRPKAVPTTWEAELSRVIDLYPRSVGVPSAVWTTRLLSAYLEEVTGHHAAIETVRVHLHRTGYVCKRPTWSLKRKSTEQAGWVKNA